MNKYFGSLLLFLAAWLSWSSRASTREAVQIDAQETDRQQIVAVLEKYFDLRYQSFQNLALADFGPVAALENAGGALASELEKLTLELEHARVFRLAYQQHEYFLDYGSIVIAQDMQRAQVTLSEGHDVVFEVAAPTVSSLRNLVHEIKLVNVGGEWKIVSDRYDDYLWRWLKTSRQSAAELQKTLPALQVPDAFPDAGGHPALPNVEAIRYDRRGAVAYAHRWSIAPRPYNAAYTDFTDLGGDCTNFVSQAIFEGGGIEMIFGGVHGIGTAGWYYEDINDRAIAWTWVDGLYNFIVHEHVFWGNRFIGYETDGRHALAGDILQFNWGSDTVWDHSVLTVSSSEADPEDPMHLVAGHSPDVDHYPYTTMVYSPDFRFIHIFSAETQSIVENSVPTPVVAATATPHAHNPVTVACPMPGQRLKRLCRTLSKPW
ncbi:MAG: amidase domain-containing protein [Chloroflexota bacterium]